MAAQSIGEPGTQLTMRTFHTGGVAGQDITQGLPRVEELFEARPIRHPAILASVAGIVSVTDEGKGAKRISIEHDATEEVSHQVPKKKSITVKVKDGEKVKAGQVLFTDGGVGTVAKVAGIVRIADKKMTVVTENQKKKEYFVPSGQMVWIKDGDLVSKGDQLTDGSLDLHQVFYLSGQEAVERYIIKEIQYIYSSQGQKLNDKHIEVVVRQMFSRVYITESGDTNFLSGEVVERTKFVESNDEVAKKNGTLAEGEQLLLGITKASLSIDSFLSAASFQETARVLIDAAVSGKIDRLRGLKENVIIGKLIPAGTGFNPNKV
jgi:DNA-directed RNA polymerase subunit beta'